MTCNLVCKNNTATQFEEAIGYLDVNEKVVLESDDIFPSYCLANHFSDTLRTETMAIVQLILLNFSGPKRQRSVPSAFVWSARVCVVHICMCIKLRRSSWRHVRKRIGKEDFVFCFFNIHYIDWMFVTLQQFHAIWKFPNHNLM